MNTLHPSDHLYHLISSDIRNLLTGKIDNYSITSIRIANAMPIGTQNFIICIEVTIPGSKTKRILEATREHLAEVAESLTEEYRAILHTQGLIEIHQSFLRPFKKEKAPASAKA